MKKIKIEFNGEKKVIDVGEKLCKILIEDSNMDYYLPIRRMQDGIFDERNDYLFDLQDKAYEVLSKKIEYVFKTKIDHENFKCQYYEPSDEDSAQEIILIIISNDLEYLDLANCF